MLTCPGCQVAFTVTGPTGDGFVPPPAVGAMTVCTACGAVGVFADGPFGLTIRAADRAELPRWAAG